MSPLIPAPGLVDRKGLLLWGKSLSAREHFPRLIRRLILETAVGLDRVDFPADEGVSLKGLDGVAVCSGKSAFIPAGTSLWELSAGASTTAKAITDFDKRKETPDGSPTTASTYCAVSIRPWQDRRAFAKDRKAIGRWRDVRAYGVDDLLTWLEDAPAAHTWLSEQLGYHPAGRTMPDRWWQRWAAETSPPLPTAVVLAGREEQIALLRHRLAGEPTITTISCASQDEVIAFFAAVAITSTDEADVRRMSNAVIVTEPISWRALDLTERRLILVAGNATVVEAAEFSAVHHVILPVDPGLPADISLAKIDSHLAAAALTEAGLAEAAAQEVGQMARTSLQTARRHLSVSVALHTAPWARAPIPRVTRSVLLAGSWNDDSAGDRAVLAALTGTDYADLLEDLAILSAGGDPLVVKNASTWTVVSPIDSWQQIQAAIRGDDLDRLSTAATPVLLEADPDVGQTAEERLSADLSGGRRQHSGALRAGLAQTLALLGTFGGSIDAAHSQTGADKADEIVRGLLRAANGDNTGLTWTVLAAQLPTLVEAAPEAFISELLNALSAEDSPIQKLFTDRRESVSLLGPRSAHPDLIWAIERLAWSVRYFGQAIDLIARIAERDPGGEYGRRPAESLADILCAWHPETAAPLASRLDALDALRGRHAALAWPLMQALVPAAYAVHMHTASPRFRDWKPPDHQTPPGDVLAFIAGVVNRIVKDAEKSPGRWVELLTDIQKFAPSTRAEVRQGLTDTAEGNRTSDEQQAVWKSLSDLVRTHREFASAQWALPADEVDKFDQVAELFAPAKAIDRNAWLFESEMPHLGDPARLDDYNGYRGNLSAQRAKALTEVEAEDGWSGVIALARRAAAGASAIGVLLAERGQTAYEGELLPLLDSDVDAECQLAAGYLGTRFDQSGWEWLTPILDASADLPPRHVARLLICAGDHPRDWEEAHARGEDVEREYWLAFRTWGLGHDYQYLTESIRGLLSVERVAAAVELAGSYSYSPNAADAALALVAADALEALAAQPAGQQQPASYHLGQLFGLLDAHKDAVGTVRVAQLEWIYLPALRFESSTPTLQEALSSDPSFFVQVLSFLYRAETEAPPQPSEDDNSEHKAAAAANAYRLLTSWHLAPGHRFGDELDAAKLESWVHTTLPMLKDAGLSDVGEIHIGQVLGRTAPDLDGNWPPVIVRDLLEKLQSTRIENGMATSIINSRGMTSRAVDEGGAQERGLAVHYERAAEALADKWPRSADLLRGLAASYTQMARTHDSDAERWRQGLRP